MTATGATSVSHDTRGNISAIGAASYGYSSENLLTSGPSSVALSYDPMLRLYQASGGATTRFAYDGLALIAEHDGSNTLLRRYVHGPGVDEPLVQYEGTGTSDRRFLHADERGSIVALTDSAGALVGSLNLYDEYGRPQGTMNGRFGYTGQTWIPELNLWYYKARMYNPSAPGGRFMQTDPIGYGDGMNLYGYVGGDPVNFTDPLGLSDEPVPPGPEGPPMDVCGGGEFVGGRCISNSTLWRLNLISIASGHPMSLSLGGGTGNALYDYVFQPLGVPFELEEPDCSGPVRVVGLSGTAIPGAGFQATSGLVRVMGSGEMSIFVSYGLGTGADVGVSLSLSEYASLDDFMGNGKSFSGSVGFLGFTRNYNSNGQPVGGGASSSRPGATAPFGLRAGVSGVNSQTRLLTGRCKR